jgi:hypothetical protein
MLDGFFDAETQRRRENQPRINQVFSASLRLCVEKTAYNK